MRESEYFLVSVSQSPPHQTIARLYRLHEHSLILFSSLADDKLTKRKIKANRTATHSPTEINLCYESNAAVKDILSEEFATKN